VAELDPVEVQEPVVREEQEGADQHAVEDPRQVVQRAVADPLHVAVVEAVGLEDQDPDRK
jgi:hypothetical protein